MKIRHLIPCIILTCLSLTSPAFAELTDRQISDECVAHATGLLAKNTKNAAGLLFFRLAETLTPTSDSVLLTKAYLDRGAAPEEIKAKVNQSTLLSEIKEKGRSILKNRFRNNEKIGKLALVYYLFSDHFNKKDEDILRGIAYLRSYGFTSKLNKLLSKDFDLKSLYNSTKKPSKDRGAKLSKKDIKIAKNALPLASALLAKDAGSDQGLLLLQLADILKPSEYRAQLIFLKLQRNIAIKTEASKISLPTLNEQIVNRGDFHLKSAKDSPLSAHLALLYFRIGDALQPNMPKAMLGLLKMEKMGRTDTLKELMKIDIKELADSKSTPSSATTTNAKEPDTDTSSGNEDAVVLDPKRVKHKVWVRPNKGRANNGDYDDKIQFLDIRTTIDNWTKGEIKNFKCTVRIIGRSVLNKNSYQILEVYEDSLSLARKQTAKFCHTIKITYDDNAAAQYGHKYYGYVLAIFDASGKLFLSHASSSKLKKDIDKIIKTPPEVDFH